MDQGNPRKIPRDKTLEAVDGSTIVS
jgi:hypothetical protein